MFVLVSSSPVAVTQIEDIRLTLSKKFVVIEATRECGFTLKQVYDMTRTYSQMQHIDKFSQHTSIIWAVWPNGSVLVYKLSSFGFKSRCSHLILAYHCCFEQGASKQLEGID